MTQLLKITDRFDDYNLRENVLIRSAFGRSKQNMVWFSLLLWLGLAWTAAAQTQPIQAGVNKTMLSAGEQVELTVVVVDDSAQQPRPILPRLDGLAVIDLDIATDVNLANGQINSEVTYTYRLQPRRTGSLTIPPVTVTIDNQTWKTSPIALKVEPGAAPQPPPAGSAPPENAPLPAIDGQDLFVEAQVDLTSPYVGQQVIHTFRFYQNLQGYRTPEYDTPPFDQFEAMSMPVDQYSLNTDEGQEYLVTEVKTALFPIEAGRVIIEPARLNLPATTVDPPVELYTRPVQLEVRPLPDNELPGFNGAVGRFEIKAWLNPQTAVVNQPVTLFVAVSGIGNVRDLPELTWPELENWQAFNSLTSLTTSLEENVFTGSRVYERVMVPSAIGEFVVPPISLIYFDPIAAEYRAIQTESLAIQVDPLPAPQPDGLSALPTATPVGGPGVQAAPTANVGASAWANLWGMVVSVVRTVSRWMFIMICGVLPVGAVLFFGGSWLWRNRAMLTAQLQEAVEQAKIEQNRSQARKTPPPPPAAPRPQPVVESEAPPAPAQTIHPALAAAMKGQTDNFKAVSQALIGYLTDALQTPVNGLTRRQLLDRLQAEGVDQRLARRVETCLETAELSRYGPQTEDSGWSLMVETDDLLFALDRVFEPDEPAD